MTNYLRYIALGVLSFIIVSIGSIYYIKYSGFQKIECSFKYRIKHEDKFQVFYAPDDKFKDEESITVDVTPSEDFKEFSVAVPVIGSQAQVRIDFGQNTNNKLIELKDFYINNESITPHNFNRYFKLTPFITLANSNEIISLQTSEKSGLWSNYDPFVHTEPFRKELNIWSIVLILLVASLFGLAVFLSSYFKFKNNKQILNPNKNVPLEYYFVFLYFVLLTLPWLDEEFQFTAKLNENRTLAQKPIFSFSKMDTYTKAFNDYYNDNFGLRSWLIQKRQSVRLSLLGEVVSDRVIAGKGGWLFFYDSTDAMFKSYTRNDLLNYKELEEFNLAYNERKKNLNANGIAYYRTFYPNPHTIYEEFIPSNLSLCKKDTLCKWDQFINYLKEKNSNLTIIDNRESLLEAKKINVIYRKNDTHWNELGAFAAYYNIMSNIKKDIPEISPLDLSDYDVKWDYSVGEEHDMLDILGIEEINYPNFNEEIPICVPKNDSLRYQVDIAMDYKDWDNNTFHTYNPLAKNKLKLLIFRDSYTRSMYKFLSGQFSEVVYVWKPFDYDIIKNEKPNIVLQASVERYFY